MDESKKDEKTVMIFVNTREKHVAKGDVTFDQIIALAYEVPPNGENVLFTVMYRKAEGNKDGFLVQGGSVKAHKGMMFNVSATDKS
jgi:hypothetical protein